MFIFVNIFTTICKQPDRYLTSVGAVILRRLLVELAVIKIGIEAALCKKFVMRAAFDDITVLHNEDKIGIFYSRKSMCDNK